MSAVELMPDAPPIEEPITVPRRKFKASDLPLTPVQRSSIDSLLHTIKKKGEFDTLRKKVWSQYADSNAKTTFIASLTDLAESEIDREPLLLSRDRGKAATLIQGAVDRGDIYKSVETNIDALIAEHIIHVERAAREIRRHEVGEDVAAEEERLGSKTDEAYAKEAAVRREARDKIRKQEEARRRREEEKERLRAEEKKKMLELEKLRTADERRRDHEAREEKRKREREAQRAAEKQLEEERESQRRERYEKRKTEEKERDRDRSRDHGRTSYRDHDGILWGGDEPVRESRSRPHEKESTPIPVPQVDEKALEEAALELLLKEGRELAAKSGPRTELERSESLEPPPRKLQHPKSKLSEPSTPKLTAEDRRSTPNHEPRAATKTSYSSVNRQTVPKPLEPVEATPQHRSERSRSTTKDPSSSQHRRPSRSRSRTRFSSRWDEEKRKAEAEAKQAWKEQALRQREREAEAWKRAAREGKEPGEGRTKSRSPTRETEKAKSSHHRHHHRHNHSRSRSPRAYTRYERERSRSPRARKSYHETSSRPARRSKSPVEIDRYVPGGSSRARPHRSDDRPHRSDDRGHHRNDERPRDRDRDEKHRYVEIDRYVPGGGGGEEGKRGKGERSRSRSKM